MTIEYFIECAIEGEWRKGWYFSHLNREEAAFGEASRDSEDNPCHYVNIHAILLDPTAWKAVGSGRRWGGKNHDPIWRVEHNIEEHVVMEPWANMMLDFAFALTKGKTIEESLAKLNTT